MAAAWKVLGEPKEEVAKVVDADKLDYELFDRWLKFLAKPPRFYPYLTKWQEMIKGGGSAAEAKKLADEFQALLLDVMFDRKEIKEENDIIAAKALTGTKKKEPGKLPSDFVTNDDFCPGCGLELKSLPVERNNLWTDVFQRDLQDGFDPAQASERIKPGLLAFRGWGLERQLSADRRRYVDGAARRHRGAAQGAAAEVPVRARRRRRREAGQPQGQQARQPVQPRRRSAARISCRCCPSGDPAPFTKGSGRLELADAILRQPIAMRVIVNRIWKGHFGTGLVDTPSNFGVAGERPTNPELLEYLAQRFVDQKLSIKQLHRDIMLSAVYQLEHRARRGELREGRRQPAVLARRPPSHDGRADPRLAAVRLRRARQQDGRAVDAAVAGVRRAARSTARSAATSSTTTCSCSTFRARTCRRRSASRPPCRCSGCSS